MSNRTANLGIQRLMKDPELTMAAIHLIRNDSNLPKIAPIQKGSDIFQSGFWVIATATANALKGGKSFFHEKQSEPSFFGGEIMDFKKVKEGEYEGRRHIHVRVGSRVPRD